MQSCSVCGEFGHTKSTHSKHSNDTKNTTRCAICGELGHWRNSNKQNLSGLQTKQTNADCKLWNKKNKKQWKKEVLLCYCDLFNNAPQAIAAAGFQELDLSSTKGIKYSQPLFPFIPLERVVPPMLHVTLLGVVQKGIKIIAAVCRKHDGEDTTSQRLAQFHNILYNDLHVLATHYHGGDFTGNDAKKILDKLDVVLKAVEGLPEHDIIKQYFKPLPTIVKLCNTTSILSDEEVDQLSTACKEFDTTLHCEDFKKQLPQQATRVSIKCHIITAHIVPWARKYKLTGAFSESYVRHA